MCVKSSYCAMKLRAMKLDVMKPRAMKLHGIKPHYHLLSYLSLNLYHYQIPEFYVLMMIIRVFVRNYFYPISEFYVLKMIIRVFVRNYFYPSF